ncbi:MAG TPA: hypothetical protein VMV15_08590 [Candidatus Binataceae bacterium]|nr:hypothetical protein [Candidatus Binataceae bacterium]
MIGDLNRLEPRAGAFQTAMLKRSGEARERIADGLAIDTRWGAACESGRRHFPKCWTCHSFGAAWQPGDGCDSDAMRRQRSQHLWKSRAHAIANRRFARRLRIRTLGGARFAIVRRGAGTVADE